MSENAYTIYSILIVAFYLLAVIFVGFVVGAVWIILREYLEKKASERLTNISGDFPDWWH